MSDALIGYTGFVGSSLLRQRRFEHLYNSTNIDDVRGKRFDLVVCSGAPGSKWTANRQPEQDRANITHLIECLQEVECTSFVLVSTVDVFKTPIEVDEHSEVEEVGLHPYGLHRRNLEQFVERRFDRYIIARLAGLVGPGLRKNVVFDLLNHNHLETIDSRAIYQFYPLVNLWWDLKQTEECSSKLIHLTAEPVSVREIAELGFGMRFEQILPSDPPRYDMRSCFAQQFSGQQHYQYSKRETIIAVRSYVQENGRTS